MQGPTETRIRSAIMHHLEKPLRRAGFSPESIDADFNLLDNGVLDSLAIVELVVGVIDDLDLRLDLGDLAEASFTTVRDISESFRRAGAE